MDRLFAGFDIGTDCVSAVVMDSRSRIVYSPGSVFHFGNPVHVLKDFYLYISIHLGEAGMTRMTSMAFTGAGGERFAGILNIPYYHDTISIPSGVAQIYPDARYVFHIGARDSYFFEIEKIGKEHDLVFVPDHGTGTKCGGGSGILITKQCRRFFESGFPVDMTDDTPGERRRKLNQRLSRIFMKADEEIRQCNKDIDVGGRCGVVIQSDMIHLQNTGEKIRDILSGLYDRIIKNYMSDVLKSRTLDTEAVAAVTGGIFESPHFLSLIRKLTGVHAVRPEHFRIAGAVGAVVKSMDERRVFTLEDLDNLADTEKQSVKTVPGLKTALSNVTVYEEEQPKEAGPLRVFHDFTGTNDRPLPVILGVDGGSTTTKAVVLDMNDKRILAEICLYTNGRPLETVQSIFRQIRDSIGDKISIAAVSYTGSSGAFYHKLFTRPQNGSSARTIDLVKDEITCHAMGVRHYNSKTDTIFELGGQDAKFTVFNPDGTVKKSRMNLSCMAGTGQTMQNMVEMLGLDIRDSFHEYALSAERTPVVDDTCGVFTEAGIARLISLGFPKNEIAAAIAYGFMGGYVNKFIGNEVFGTCASAQGGPFTGKAPLAALAMHTQMTIHAFPHRQLFGALGAALAVHEEMTRLDHEKTEYECRFRGLDLADQTFEKNEAHCMDEIQESCGIKQCRLSVYLAGDDRIITGGACPKGNTDSALKKTPDYVDLYKRILEKHLKKHLEEHSDETDNERILIPRSLTFLNEKGVFYTALYKNLGFDVCVSPETTDEISELGLTCSHSEACYPVKLAHGHAAYLKNMLRPGKDKILLVNSIGATREKHKFCPYVSGAGFLAKDAVGLENKDILLPVIYFDDPDYPLHESFHKDLLRVYGRRFTIKQVKKAVSDALKSQAGFLSDVYLTGKTLVTRLREKKENIFIGVGRGYTLLDDKASSKVHELFIRYGLHYIPSFFLEPPGHDINRIAENMYWVQGRNIVGFTLESALKPDYFPVRATNFNCGSDSMLLFHEEKIMEKAGKPHLVLQTDGHSSNAQFGTRTLAHNEVVKTWKPVPVKLADFIQPELTVILKNKIIGIPYMGDHSKIVSATFRALGYPSEVMPCNTPESKAISAKLCGSNICQPFSFQVGDSLAWLSGLKQKGITPDKAVIMEPMAKGPCRFGQYYVLLKSIIAENGYPEVTIMSPDTEKDYSNLPLTDAEIISQAKDIFKGVFSMDILYDALLRTRPYERIKGSALTCYEELSEDLVTHIEHKADVPVLSAFLEQARKRYEILIDPNIRRKPIIAVTGEIYVRLNPHANNHSILMLEKFGLETRLSPLSLWMEYINKTSIKKFRMANQWKKYIKAVLKKRYMDSVSKTLYKPFAEFLKGREAHDSEHILHHIQKDLVFDRSIEGESPLSIGEAYMFASGKLPDISGIFHVGPFGCMQEIAATSQIQAITRKIRMNAGTPGERIIPFMDAVFGDSELSNLEAEIAAFSEKCYLKKQLNP